MVPACWPGAHQNWDPPPPCLVRMDTSWMDPGPAGPPSVSRMVVVDVLYLLTKVLIGPIAFQNLRAEGRAETDVAGLLSAELSGI